MRDTVIVAPCFNEELRFRAEAFCEFLACQ